MKLRHLLLVTGLVTTVAVLPVQAHEGHDGAPQGQPGHHGHCLSSLPQDKAEMIRQSMRAHFEKNKAVFLQMHKLHQEIHAIMTADSFNRDAFLKKSAEIDALEIRMKHNRELAMADDAAKLTATERRTIAQCMMHEGHGGHPGGWRHGDRGKGGWHGQHHGWDHNHGDHDQAAGNRIDHTDDAKRDDNGGSPRHDE